jgi:hypothetical protein
MLQAVTLTGGLFSEEEQAALTFVGVDLGTDIQDHTLPDDSVREMANRRWDELQARKMGIFKRAATLGILSKDELALIRRFAREDQETFLLNGTGQWENRIQTALELKLVRDDRIVGDWTRLRTSVRQLSDHVDVLWRMFYVGPKRSYRN